MSSGQLINPNLINGDSRIDASRYVFQQACTRPVIEVLLSPGAAMPKRAHDTDAGADLFPLQAGVIAPGEQKMIDTGVAVKIPRGYAGFIHMRSSQRKNRLTGWGTGIIDSDYRGTLRVIIANNGDTDYVYDEETAIAQLVIQKVELVDFVDIWNDTERGTGGFGSTNKQ